MKPGDIVNFSTLVAGEKTRNHVCRVTIIFHTKIEGMDRKVFICRRENNGTMVAAWQEDLTEVRWHKTEQQIHDEAMNFAYGDHGQD